MKQVALKQGKIEVVDVPAPQIQRGRVLIKTRYSCISAGTEGATISASGVPLWKKVLQKPEQIKKAFELASKQGISGAFSFIKTKIDSYSPLGYSAAGDVIAIGEGIIDIKIGDRVACAGAQCAHHAEIISVPRNLVVQIPDCLDYKIASTATLGAIALQGVRRFNPTMGETVVVIGLGLLGQITLQLLKTNGCYVAGIDPDKERTALAEKLGMDFNFDENNIDSVEQQIARLTDGYGADGVIITATSSSNEIISKAFKMCRKRGRVVLVGVVGLNINRDDMYAKELDFFISCSYGPGRYDTKYEEQSFEYPLPYVRWTENRNLAQFIKLCADEKINVAPLITASFTLDKAEEAYHSFDAEHKPLITLLEYPADGNPTTRIEFKEHKLKPASSDKINLALVGAGSFAKTTHLPIIKKLENKCVLAAVCSRDGLNALNIARQYGAQIATTNFDDILKEKNINAVLIATRHNLHATMTLRALETGKHVFVEKPLALTEEELARIEDFYGSSSASFPILHTGFNRRFSPHATMLKKIIEKRTNPLLITYRMNAGYMPADCWVHSEEGGGRNIGEACHIYDFLRFIIGRGYKEVTAKTICPSTAYYQKTDNFGVIIQFQDGSIANVVYTAMGNKTYPKELVEIFFDGKIAVLDNFITLNLNNRELMKSASKGHYEELEAFFNGIKSGKFPIPPGEQFEAMKIAFDVEKYILA
jgi:predicted dehydrogenase